MKQNSHVQGRLQLHSSPVLAYRWPIVSRVHPLLRRAVLVWKPELNSSKSPRAVGDRPGRGRQYTFAHNPAYGSHVKNQKCRLKSRRTYKEIGGDENIWQAVFSCYSRRLYCVRIQYDATNHPERHKTTVLLRLRRGKGR